MKYLNEFVATLIFIFAILCITSIKDLPIFQVALAIGLSLTVSIMIAASFKGQGHLNPAVSFIMGFKDDNFKAINVLVFIILQFVAALVAYGLFKLINLENDSSYEKFEEPINNAIINPIQKLLFK